MNCMWCMATEVTKTTKNCYWIMPDGKSALEILQIPALACKACGTYLTDEMNHEIDIALYARELPKDQTQISYQQLIEAPYKNIFSTE